MKRIFSFLSWRNWGIIRYNSIWQNISLLFFILLQENNYSWSILGKFILFLLFSTLTTGYGYLINDFSDRKIDKQQGKKNAFEDTSSNKALLITFSTLGISLLLCIPFLHNFLFIIFLGIWLFIATFYSLPPFRFKENGLLGLILIVLAQQTLPALIMLAAFSNSINWPLLSFILYATIRGFSSDTGHQMRDWENDIQTNTRTFAVITGFKKTQFIYSIFLEAERLALGLLIVSLFISLDYSMFLFGFQFSPVFILIFMYLVLIILTIGSSIKALRKQNLQSDPYDEERQKKHLDWLQIIHHSFPSVFMPLFLAILMTLKYPPYLLFILILLLIYSPNIFSFGKRLISSIN